MNAYFAEFFGTALLILLGNGVVANVCLNKTKGQSSGWIVITTAWAFAVYVAVVVTGPYSGAHLNPAVTLGVAMKGAFAWELVPGYIAAQVVGGMVGALLVYIMYKDHFAATEEEGLKRACFCTEPAIRNYPINLVNEIVGTFVLVFVIFYLAGANITLPGTAESTPIGLSLGGTTGYAINPARDLGPRLTLGLFLGGTLKTKADWGYSWVPVVGPFIGAALAAVFYNAIM